jgi:tetratricopeptide (TPR) repeat protein
MDRARVGEWVEVGLGHANRAIALRPGNPDALEVRALLVYWKYLLNLAASPAESERLRNEAEQGFRASIAAGGQRAFALTSLSHLLLNKGEVAEAKLSALRAYQADPFLESVNLTIWRIFTASWNLQDVVEARRSCEEGVRRFPNDFRFIQCQLMEYALPGERPDVDRAWQLLARFTELSPPQVRAVNELRGFMYVGIALARASSGTPRNPQLADSARSVFVRGRSGPEIDPLREAALLESIGRVLLGDTEEAVRQLGAHLAANPGALEGYKNDSERNELPWYHRALLDEPRFRALVGIR